MRRTIHYAGEPTSFPIDTTKFNILRDGRKKALASEYIQSLQELTPVVLDSNGYVQVAAAGAQPIGYVFFAAEGSNGNYADSSLGSLKIAVQTYGARIQTDEGMIETTFDADVPVYVGAGGLYTTTDPGSGVVVGKTVNKKAASDPLAEILIYAANKP